MANKLELTWYGKEQEISVEPRLLIERPELSNTDAAPDTENMLIHGSGFVGVPKGIERGDRELTFFHFFSSKVKSR